MRTLECTPLNERVEMRDRCVRRHAFRGEPGIARDRLRCVFPKRGSDCDARTVAPSTPREILVHRRGDDAEGQRKYVACDRAGVLVLGASRRDGDG